MNFTKFKLLEENLPVLAEILKAIGHPQRLRILEALAAGEKSVGALVEMLDIPQAIVSQHLRIMRNSGVVCLKRVHTNSFYSLAHEGLRDLLHCLAKCQTHCLPPKLSQPYLNAERKPDKRRRKS